MSEHTSEATVLLNALERGSPKAAGELLERGGYYAELAEKQRLEEEIVNA